MKKFLLLLPTLLFLSTYTNAQDIRATETTSEQVTGTISGRVLDDEDKKPLEGTSVRIFTLPDSSLVGGMSADSVGRFSVKELPLGRYMAEVEMMGYATMEYNVQLTAATPTINLGDVILTMSEYMLNVALVTANAIPVTVRDDTVQYNASAYRVQEGSMLEELIKKLPGAEIDEEGNIKINGKELTKILVDGKEFFSDDPKVAIKNLPANMVNAIKAYEKKSDFTRQTGIDDGNEEYVLDLQVKPNMKQGWVGNIALGKGSEDRYIGTLNANRFRDGSHFSIVGGANNVNNQGFSEFGGRGRGNFGGGGGGITASKNLGISFAKDYSEKLHIGGDVNFRHSDNDASRRSHSDTQYGDSMGTISDSYSGSRRTNDEISFNFRVEWKPDTLTTITLRPNLSTSKTFGEQYSGTSSSRWETNDLMFPTDPLLILPEDVQNAIINGIPVRLMRVNDNDGNNESHDKSFQVGSRLSLVRRLNAQGRNVSLNLNYNFQERTSDELSYSNMVYHQRRPWNTATGAYDLLQDSVRTYNRFNDGNNKSTNWSAGASYSEPLWTSETNRAWLQLNYNFSYRKTNSSRYGYEYNYATDYQGIGIADWHAVDWSLVPDSMDLSSVYENLYTSHNFEVSMRHNFMAIDTLGRSRIRAELNYGLTLTPQHSETNNLYGPNMYKGLVQQDVVNWSPNLRFRYRFTPQESFQFTYRGRSNAPNVDNLQEVISKTNPQNIRYGNPALKPSFQHSANMNYDRFNAETRRSINAYAGFNTTQNTTATKTLNDRNAGSRVSKVVNLSGNWNTNANVSFNLPLDKKNRLNLSLSSNFRYSENKNLEQAPMTLAQIKNVLSSHVATTRLDSILDVTDLFSTEVDLFEVAESKTRNLGLGQRITFSYQTAKLEFRVNGSVNYNKITNNTQTTNNRETYDYRTGGSTIINLPHNIALSTDVNFTHRDGYSAGLKNNEVQWNAQISKSFMANNAAMLRFNIYDILREQTNISRSISAMTITDTEYNTLGSYFMCTFTYRFNTLGGQNAFGGGGGNRGNRGDGGERIRQYGGGGPPMGGFNR